MRCAPILTGSGGRVERGLSLPTHQTLVSLQMAGLMIGTGGQERGSPVLLLPGTEKRSALVERARRARQRCALASYRSSS